MDIRWHTIGTSGTQVYTFPLSLLRIIWSFGIDSLLNSWEKNDAENCLFQTEQEYYKVVRLIPFK